MSIVCHPIIGPFNGECPCECTLVDFTLNIGKVCQGAKIAVVVAVKYDGDIVATTCKTFDINIQGAAECDCVTFPAAFKDVITNVPGCIDFTGHTWTAEILCCNYITNPCCCEETVS